MPNLTVFTGIKGSIIPARDTQHLSKKGTDLSIGIVRLPEAEPFKQSLKLCKAIYVTQKGRVHTVTYYRRLWKVKRKL